MSSHSLVHHNEARIDLDDELQGEVRRLIERVDRQVADWARAHPDSAVARQPLLLEDLEDEVKADG